MNTVIDWFKDSNDVAENWMDEISEEERIVEEKVILVSRKDKKQATREKVANKIKEITEKNDKILKELVVEKEKKILENQKFNRYYKNEKVDKLNGIIISTEDLQKGKVSKTKKEESSDDSSSEEDNSSDEEFMKIVSSTKNCKILIVNEEIKKVSKRVSNKVSKKTVAEIRNENKEKLYSLIREVELAELKEQELAELKEEEISGMTKEERENEAKEKEKELKKEKDAQRKKELFYKTNPCKFGSNCTRKECSGYHSESDRRLPRCMYNMNCINSNCLFVHDGQEEEWLELNPIPEYLKAATIEQKPVVVLDMKAHFYKTNPCKFGSNCTRKECSGYHSESDRRLPRCMYNTKCTNSNCLFVHDGREDEWLKLNPIPEHLKVKANTKTNTKTNLVECKFGKKCTRRDCKFTHNY
jgi:hypothetical protein